MLMPTAVTIAPILVFSLITFLFYISTYVFITRYDMQSTKEIAFMSMSCFLISGFGFIFIYERGGLFTELLYAPSFIVPGILCTTLCPMIIALIRKLIVKNALDGPRKGR